MFYYLFIKNIFYHNSVKWFVYIGKVLFIMYLDQFNYTIVCETNFCFQKENKNKRKINKLG